MTNAAGPVVSSQELAKLEGKLNSCIALDVPTDSEDFS
jgi:hypothetical protein